MAKEFKGIINLDLKDSTEDWEAFLADSRKEPEVVVCRTFQPADAHHEQRNHNEVRSRVERCLS